MTEERRRITVGVLSGGIKDDTTRCVCRGVLREARLLDVNVAIFPGKYWDRDLAEKREHMYEYQHNTVFSYAGKENVDALIITAGSRGCFTSPKYVETIKEQYGGIPWVLALAETEDCISINFETDPGVAPVCADLGKLGSEALKMAVDMAQGKKVESRVVSAGSGKQGGVYGEGTQEEDGNGITDKWDLWFETIFHRYGYDEMEKQMEKLRACYKNLMEAISGYFGKDAIDGSGKMMCCMEEFIESGGVDYADVEKLLAVLEELYEGLKAGRTDDKGRQELWDVFSCLYRKIIWAKDRQLGRMMEAKEAESGSIKLFVQDMLQFERGRDQSYSTLLENLDWLYIKNACIYTLEKPVLHLFNEKFDRPEILYRKAVLKKKRVETVPARRQKKNIGHIFSGIFPPGERFECVLLPLFFKETVYGALLCDMTEGVCANGEFLINQVSSAIKMINLLQANEQIQQQLEENLAALKEHNIELDTISKSDVMTGILNRRGFYQEAEQKVEKSRSLGQAVMAVYVDMDNLKIINDRYGHNEGDHSLVTIGQFLKELVGEAGIAGRIGGDEFACVVGPEEGTEEEFLSKLYGKFETYNAGSDKPYNVMVSAGAWVVGPKDAMTLKDALMQADEKLYEVKKHRKKDVAK